MKIEGHIVLNIADRCIVEDSFSTDCVDDIKRDYCESCSLQDACGFEEFDCGFEECFEILPAVLGVDFGDMSNVNLEENCDG